MNLINLFKNSWGERKNRLLIISTSLGVILLIAFGINFYFSHTEIAPAFEGSFIEGIIGQPRFINPLYIDNDIDRDLVELLFSGLFSYNKNGEIAKDLVKDYEISENAKTFKFYLKDNIFWHDGKEITADDVIFTIEAMQNPDYKTPLITTWYGVKIEKISQKSFQISLENPYAPFLENCTVKILPKHIWEKISPDNLPLALATFPPDLLIGSGSFKFKELKFEENNTKENNTKIESITLKSNQEYFAKIPYLSQISFKFFDNEKSLTQALNKREIDGFASLSPFDEKSLANNKHNLTFLSLPRYFALFFNLQDSKILSEKKIRQVLSYATNKKEILETVFQKNAEIIDSPILSSFFNYKRPSKVYEFDLKTAQDILDTTGFKMTESGKREKIVKEETFLEFKKYLKSGSKGQEVENLQKCLSLLPEIYPEGEITGFFGKKTKTAVILFQEKYLEGSADGLVGEKTREKLNEVCVFPKEVSTLSFSITTLDDPILLNTANLLKNQWEKVDVNIEIKSYPLSELKKIIKERDYESLLFGEALGLIPDLFPFWHSSQKDVLGSNLSNYENKKADTLLTEIRQTLDENERKEKLEKLQDIIVEDIPAIFLYNPNYCHFLSNKIKGISKELKILDPSKRFVNIENWYLQTRRVWK